MLDAQAAVERWYVSRTASPPNQAAECLQRHKRQGTVERRYSEQLRQAAARAQGDP
ncbi:hypothetical protein [Streptomyces aureus]|uniref:Uncharacterized protein n=1 Tax=Streptomyces aureus TaxID=193461 RepID=A0ABV4SW74_9ACTN